MNLTDLETEKVKAIYSDYHIGAMSADEALYELEQLINEGDN
jgi:hypothetical protein